MVNSLLTLFYTDYANVPIATVGLVMLISRFFDGSSDVIMGVLVNRTHSQWGARPWILWMAIPYVICSISLFCVPQTSTSLQFWYIFVTYNLLATVCYTAINVPYGTLSTLMTRSSHERDMLSIIRMSIAPVGRLIAVTLSLPLVKLLGDTQAAWIKAMMLWSALAFILLMTCFVNCKETVDLSAVQAEQQHVGFGRSLKSLLGNKYFWAVLILWTITVVQQTLVGTLAPYYCKYIFGNDSLYSLLYMAENITLIVGALACPKLLSKFGKRDLCLAGCVLAVLAQLLLFLDSHSFTMLFAVSIVRACHRSGADHRGHLRYDGRRCGIRPVEVRHPSGEPDLRLLGAAGFVSSVSGGNTQPESAKHMIVAIYQFGILAIWVAAVVVLLLYKLDKMYPQIAADLQEHEKRRHHSD